MTTATHTPAPWDADGETIFYATPDEADAVTMIEIRANVTQAGWDTVAFIDAAWPGARDNARLIAAAPDMYEELLSLRECCLEALRGDWDGGDDGFTAMLDSIEALLIRAAE